MLVLVTTATITIAIAILTTELESLTVTLWAPQESNIKNGFKSKSKSVNPSIKLDDVTTRITKSWFLDE